MTLPNIKQGGLEVIVLRSEYDNKPTWVTTQKFLELSFMTKAFRVNM